MKYKFIGRKIPLGRILAVDTETTGLNVWKGDRPFIVVFCNEKFEVGIFQWDVHARTRYVSIPDSEIRILKDRLEDSNTTTVWHNSKFDIGMLKAIGVNVRTRVEDTLFAMHCLNNQEKSYGLKHLTEKYLRIPRNDEEDLKASIQKLRREAKANGEEVAPDFKSEYWRDPNLSHKYAVMDAVRTMGLWVAIRKEIDAENVRKTYERELEVQRVVIGMEERGVRIDKKKVKDGIYANKVEIQRIESWLKRNGPSDINFQSPKQLVRHIYSMEMTGKDSAGRATFDMLQTGLKLPVNRWSGEKKNGKGFGQPSVALVELKKLNHPYVEALVGLKSKQFEMNNFFSNYEKLMVEDFEPGQYAIHPNFKQTGATTGRFSCSGPNLQNVPDAKHTRTSGGLQARTPFGPREGYGWLLLDFSQLEVRIFAAYSGDPKLIKAITSGRDIHSETALTVWPDEDLKTSRLKAKQLVFLKIYGGGIRAAAENMDCSERDAAKFLDDFDRAFPRSAGYMSWCIDRAKSRGYVVNKYGRKLNVDRDTAYRAVNYMIQSSAADLLKDRMIACDKWLRREGIDAHIVLTVHDEVVFEISEKIFTPWIARRLCMIMEDSNVFALPIPVDAEYTFDSWTNKKPLELEPCANA